MIFIQNKNLKKIHNRIKINYLPKLFVVFFVVLLISPLDFDFAFAAPKIDTINLAEFDSCDTTATNTCTTGISTVASGDIFVVVVGIVEAGGTANAVVSALSWNGGTETLTGGDFVLQGTFQDSGTGDTTIQVFEAATLTLSSSSLVVTLDKTDNDFAVGLYRISGAAPGSFVGGTATSATTNAAATDSVTSVDTNSLIIGVFAAATDTTSATADGGVTLDLSSAPASGTSLVGFSHREEPTAA